MTPFTLRAFKAHLFRNPRTPLPRLPCPMSIACLLWRTVASSNSPCYCGRCRNRFWSGFHPGGHRQKPVAWHGCDMLWCHTKGAWCAMKEPIVPHWVWAHWISGWSFFSWIMSSPAFGFWLALWMKERVVDSWMWVQWWAKFGFMVPCSLADVEEMTTGFSTTRPTLQ